MEVKASLNVKDELARRELAERIARGFAEDPGFQAEVLAQAARLADKETALRKERSRADSFGAIRQRLRIYLDRSGESESGFAKRAGVSVSSVKMILKGGGNGPTLAVLCDVAAALGVTVAEFVTPPPVVAVRKP